ncbi:hypothetical protein H0B56_14460 [Haloechinothrix sp. YIM 98757]|uniref:Uncharacterized protein n=1 Tax=Haloechinothrix aidingensis TaxID=2752311 RepID=A0A838ABW9_9PSEU|nr:hypothetical protein [Haloechinothrix aidingensis]MBA0126749.1 hypothetical protein [Haloechinothrix aidingensis]
MTTKALRWCTWAGPVWVGLLAIGFVIFAGFMPPPSPELGADAVAQMYADNQVSMQIGMAIMMCGAAIMGPWGVAISVWTRRTEAGFPVLTYTQLVSLGCGVAIFVILYIPWGVATFRPLETSPEITQMLNDFGWFMFLMDVPPFIIWVAAIGLGILWNPGKHQAYPRWVGYYSLCSALLMFPGLFLIFFKTGPLAWNGLLAFYVLMAEILTWALVMTVYTERAIRQYERKYRHTGIGDGDGQVGDEDGTWHSENSVPSRLHSEGPAPSEYIY